MNDFKLHNNPKIATGFKIPAHYFDDLSAKVMQQLPEKNPKVISIFKRRKVWFIGVAAVLVISLSISIINKYNTESNTLDQETLENYLTTHAQFSDDDLAALLNESDIQKMESDYTLEGNTIEDILSTNTNLEEYIID